MGAALLHGTALAQVSVPDFRLPSGTPTTTPQPEREGPVAPDVPESRATPTPVPAPRPAQTPTGAPAVQPPPPLVVPPTATPAPSPTRTARPASTPAPTSTREAAPVAEPAPPAETTPVPVPTPSEPAADAPQPLPVTEPTPAAAGETDKGGITLLGWLAIGALLAAGALWLVLRRRGKAEEPQPAERTRPVPPAAPPVPPPPAPAPTPAPPPVPAPAPAPVRVDIGLAGVEMHVTSGRLSLSLMNAALSFQLALRHDGPAPLTGLTLRGDLIGAHAALRQDEQLGGPAPDAPVLAQLASLPAGEALTINAEVRLPLAQVAAIRQGRSSLFVPLLRLALEGEGQDRRMQTTLIGPPGQGGQVQPVRLDMGPRVVSPLLFRVLG